MKRPTSVTVIAWILIVTSGISMISSLMSLNNPMVKDLMAKSPIPIPIQYVMLCLGLLISAVSGVAFLKGQNWARYLYVGWSALGFVIGFATSPMKMLMLPGLAFFIVVSIFLFRPVANNYFSPAEAGADAQGI